MLKKAVGIFLQRMVAYATMKERNLKEIQPVLFFLIKEVNNIGIKCTRPFHSGVDFIKYRVFFIICSYSKRQNLGGIKINKAE